MVSRYGAPNVPCESRTAIALLIDAAIADLVRRRGGSEAAFKGIPKGIRIPFDGP